MDEHDVVRRVAAAYLMAARAHADQQRRGFGAVPYINHPAEVADLVARAGATANEVIAAVLHDVVEDSDVTEVELEAGFGTEVARIVAELTNPPEWEALPKLEMKTRQADHVARTSRSARRIKIADQTSNLRDILRDPSAWDRDRGRDYITGSSRVVEACRGTDAWLEAQFDEIKLAADAAFSPGIRQA